VKVALLCSGPSLVAQWSQANPLAFDVVIAINRAGWLCVCDWLAFVDIAIIDRIKAEKALAPREGYITHQNHKLPPPSGWINLPWYGKPNSIPEVIRTERGDDVCGYTTPSALLVALVTAGSRGSVDIYGMDCTPEPKPDCGGWTQTGCHGSSRWLAELPWLRAARAQYPTIPVEIHGPCPAAASAYVQGTAHYNDLLPLYGHKAMLGVQ